MANYYVTKSDDGWAAKKEHAQRASNVFKTQADAIKNAKQLSKNSGGGEVRIQGNNYKFIDSDTVFSGKDPFPPRDKKY